jgi:hypothetical protein
VACRAELRSERGSYVSKLSQDTLLEYLVYFLSQDTLLEYLVYFVSRGYRKSPESVVERSDPTPRYSIRRCSNLYARQD